ncbi:MAG: hypothetical protein PWQ87_150 [Candidatus Woesearchaeota archaeon]|nr:hypothetical protein [Candidatus Woesearchaeota archaeon]
MKKNAQGLSLSMIVIGAIAIVVVVVVITFATNNLMKQRGAITETTEGGVCPGIVFNSTTECYMNGGEVVAGKFSNVKGGQVCCKITTS